MNNKNRGTVADAITIVKKIKMSTSLTKLINNQRTSIQESKEYLTMMKPNIPDSYINFHYSRYLLGLTSIIDESIRGILEQIYLCFPQKIKNLKVTVDELLATASVLGSIDIAVQAHINSLLYKGFKELNESFCSEALTEEINLNLVEKIIEMKATRDLIAHGEKKYNKIYYAKTNGIVSKSENKDVYISYEYVENATICIEEYLEEIIIKLKPSYMKWNEARAIEEMWNKSIMADILDFNKAWSVRKRFGDKLSADPTTIFREEYKKWSSSEKLVADLFLTIHGGKIRELDASSYMMKWPDCTYEGSLLLSWLQNPFHF